MISSSICFKHIFAIQMQIIFIFIFICFATNAKIYWPQALSVMKYANASGDME